MATESNPAADDEVTAEITGTHVERGSLRRLTRRGQRSLTLVLVVAVAIACGLSYTAASALAPTATATAVVTVSGTTAKGSTTIRVTHAVTVAEAGICVRNAAGVAYDFPMKQLSALAVTGTTITGSQVLPAGTYTYWSCLRPVGGWWQFIGDSQRFTIASSVMPRANLAGWTQTFAEDFTKTAAAGTFPGPYSSRWGSYDGFRDSTGAGLYDSSIISAHDGVLDLFLHPEAGVTRVAAPVPLIKGAWAGQTYGRYSARFKADDVAGLKVAWLLWPDSDNWNHGEIDFPESYLNGRIFGFNHCLANPRKNCYWVDTGAASSSWHIVTLEWTPKRISFIVDGTVMGSTTTNIPRHPMHWVLQTETISKKHISASGHVLIDWVTIDKYTP